MSAALRSASAELRVYRALARASLRSVLAYQSSLLFGLLGSAFGMLAMLYLWQAVLADGRTGAGFDWPHMKAYLLVGFVAGSVVSSWTDYRMAFRIMQGDVAMDLVRPVDYQRARFAETVGFACYEAGLALVVVVLSALVFGGVPWPGPAGTALFVLSALLVLPLRFGIVYASGLLIFWTQNYVGIQMARVALVTLFSGALVPFAFFPDWLHAVADVLPFAGMASTPALVFVGSLTGTDAVRAVAVQAAWAAALWWLARLWWNRASRQLTVHGG
jgi:viologen exporter family transport system permease protein